MPSLIQNVASALAAHSAAQYRNREELTRAAQAWAAQRSREESEATSRLQAALASVPTQRLKKDEDEACIICHEHMVVGEECRRLPCLHLFHTGCIDRWLRVKATCPLDNLKLEDMLSAQESIQSGGSWASVGRAAD